MRTRATFLGLVAIALWSTSVPATRDLLERLGTLPGTSLSLLLAGTFLLLATSAQTRGLGWIGRLSVRHLLLCGPLFIAYFACLNLALGMAETRSEAIVVGLVNYLWPTFVLVFSVALSPARPRPLAFLAGIGVSLGGITLAASAQFASLGIAPLAGGVLPLLVALGASVVWGLYSNLTRRFQQSHPAGAVGLFLFLGGAALGLASPGRWSRIDWTPAATLELAYVVVFPLSLAYALWDVAMRDGSLPLVGSASNLIPILSTAISATLLGVPFRAELLGGAALVVLGALLSPSCVSEPQEEGAPSRRERARSRPQAAVDCLRALLPATTWGGRHRLEATGQEAWFESPQAY